MVLKKSLIDPSFLLDDNGLLGSEREEAFIFVRLSVTSL